MRSTSFSEACVALSRNTPLPLEVEFYRKCTVNICCVFKNAIKIYVLFGDPGTLFYTEGTALPLKKSPWSKLMLLSQMSYLKIAPLETTSHKSSSSHWLQFFHASRGPCAFCYSGLLVKKIFVQTFHMHTPTPVCTRACAHARVCAQLRAKSGKKGCPGSREDAGYCKNTTVRTQPIQPENYHLT